MEQVFYSNNMGQGIIEDTDIELELIHPLIKVAGEILIKDTFTSMSGYFKESLKYCGVLDNNKLVFEIGSQDDMFESKTYYQVVNYISENVLFVKYTETGGRDYRFINNQWK
jgi:predicted NUDIX family phosphoesterase